MQIFFFLVGVFLQWTLEVLGAGGAIWGMSEVWHLRGDTTTDPIGTNDELRIPANIVFCLGFVRMFFRYSSDSALKNSIVDPQVWVHNRGAASDGASGMVALEIIGFCMGFFLQWVLEVLGAGGASWGMSEVWNLRNVAGDRPGETNHTFRWVANVIFTIAIFRMAQKYCPPHAVHMAMLSPQDWIQMVTAERKGEATQQDVEMMQVQAQKDGDL